jgi:hypothetical protein
MTKRYLLSLLAVCGAMWTYTAIAQAETHAPGWELYGYSTGANLEPGSKARLEVMVYNTGEAEGQEGPTVTLTLPRALSPRARAPRKQAARVRPWWSAKCPRSRPPGLIPRKALPSA